MPLDAPPSGDKATVADISTVGHLVFPKEEAGYDFAVTHPAISGWLGRLAALPRWQAPCELPPGERPRKHV